MGKAWEVDLGFSTRDQVVTLSFDPSTQGYSAERVAAFEAELLRRAQAVPGVRSAALATTLPFGGTLMRLPFSATGDRTDRGAYTFTSFASAGYHGTLGIPIVRGRDIGAMDTRGAPHVMVVNQAMARRLWPGHDPIGRTLEMEPSAPPITVVGVARDVRFEDVATPAAPMAVLPLAQQSIGTIPLTLLARSERPAEAADLLRREVAAMDGSMPVTGPRTLSAVIADQLAPRRAGSLLVTLFGALALLLAVVGTYAVVSSAVARRTREVGVRMALGARGRDVLALFAGQGARMVGAGVGAGLLLSLATARLLSGYLLGVGPADLPAFAGGAVVLAAATLLAGWLPARRATAVDPMVALRND
jgi:predicted permease